MKGRKPKPLHLHALHGTAGGRKPPRPAGGLPRCPAWLDREAKSEWKRVAPELARLGLLTGLDRAALAAYCAAWATWRAAVELTQREGLTYKAGGLVKRHPAAAIASNAARDLRLLGECFGLTPLSRQRLGTPAPAAEVDEFEAFLESRN